MIKNTGVIQTLCKKSLLYHKKDLTFEKYIIIVFCKSNLSNMSLKEFLCVICVVWFVGFILFYFLHLYENSNKTKCRNILNESAYNLTYLQVEYYEKNCKSN